MRILISSSTYYPSMNGQAIFTVNLAEGLAAKGHTVTVVFASERGRPYRSERKGVRLEHVRSLALAPAHPTARLPLPSAKEIRQILNDARPELIHIQDHYSPSGLILREARRRGIQAVGSNHFMPENLAPYFPGISAVKPLFNRLLWKWMLQTYNQMEAIVAQSRAAAALVQAQGPRPPVLSISCGIDLRRFHPDPGIDRAACRARHGLDPERTIFLFVGRVDKEKRVDLLLRAVERLKRDDVQLVVAGHGAGSRDYQAMAKSMRLGERVRFTGFIPNDELHILLNSVDIFTMPSDAELLSIASLEAMACGRPLLLANAVALPELVTPGVNGYLFEPGNAADAAKYMEVLANQRNRWAQMGRASLARAQEHSLENTIRRYEALYEQVLGGRVEQVAEAELQAEGSRLIH